MHWRVRSTFTYLDFPADVLVTRKGGRSISVCIPARDEQATIGPIVSAVREELLEGVGLVDEILVVDDSSADSTAAVAESAGARVVAAAEVLPEHHPGPGKGQAMWKATFEAVGDLLVFLDADVVGFGAHFVTGIIGPLLLHDDTALVKGAYRRPLRGSPDEGGRVTELVARPAVALLFPALSHIRQPLAGETAARREVLEMLPFSAGYGVELGLLVDAAERFGPLSISDVDLGERVHRNRSLAELRPQATAVLSVALRRAGLTAQSALGVSLIEPPEPPADEAELPPLVDIPSYRRRSA